MVLWEKIKKVSFVLRMVLTGEMKVIVGILVCGASPMPQEGMPECAAGMPAKENPAPVPAETAPVTEAVPTVETVPVTEGMPSAESAPVEETTPTAETIPLTEDALLGFTRYMRERELSNPTIQKYLHAVRELQAYAEKRISGKEQIRSFKEELSRKGLKKRSINTKLAAVNCFLQYAGRAEWKVKYLKVQRELFRGAERNLGTEEYRKLVKTAEEKGKKRTALFLETLCGLGIRVSELPAITAECLQKGEAEISLKGKTRKIILTETLAMKLKSYCQENEIEKGPIFITRTGKPLDRSYIWKALKKLAEKAGIEKEKVYPHNFRHLFAITYYQKHKDIVRLADILGHSSVNTTRIYTVWDGKEQREQLDQLDLVA